MRISRLVIRGLRRHAALDIELAPGLTVIRGPNESGKTTIQRALEVALFRRVTATGVEVDSLRSWSSPDDPPYVRVDFTQEDLDGRRAGFVEKVFGGSRGTVLLDLDGEQTNDPAKSDAQLAELTGIPTEAFFRSTASVRHHELADLDRDDGALRDRLQASISGADRGTSVTKRRLERALHDLSTRGEKNPGRLKVAEDAVAQAEAKVQSGEDGLAQLQQDRDTLVGARERRNQAETILTERLAMLEKARQAERLGAERTVAHERFERYRQAVAVADHVVALEAAHPSPEPLPVLRQLVGRLRSLDGSVRELRAALGEEVNVEFDVRPPETAWRANALLGGALMVAALLLGLVALAASTPLLFIGSVVLVVVAAVVGYMALRERRAQSGFIRQRQLRDDQIARRLRGRTQIAQELRQAEADFARQLGLVNLPDLPAAEQLLAMEEAHVAAIGRLQGQLEGLVGHEPVETLPALRDAAALEMEQKAHAIEALGPIAREPRARERLEVEVRDQEMALERARDDEAGARARLEANPTDAEQVAAEVERLAMWREQLAVVQRRARVYRLALEAIQRAEETTMRTATRYLEKHMIGDLERISGGRYRRVDVDDQTLDIRVFAPERRDWVAVSQLSQGTIDAIYLAARIGLVRLVTEDRRPPLVFDDPFVTFDIGRAEHAIALLRELAADFQVIYLTCSDRYDKLADLVVELPAATERDEEHEGVPT